MSTFKQIYLRKKESWNTKKKSRLLDCPQVRGVVMRTRIATPRKPNSARRPIAKIVLVNKNRVTAHIPGVGHNLKRYASTLVCGGGARDLPGVRFTCIRGVYDLAGTAFKKNRRSIYGIKQLEQYKNKIRRKFRQA
jgi:small subunit ribosomal protein S12